MWFLPPEKNQRLKQIRCCGWYDFTVELASMEHSNQIRMLEQHKLTGSLETWERGFRRRRNVGQKVRTWQRQIYFLWIPVYSWPCAQWPVLKHFGKCTYILSLKKIFSLILTSPSLFECNIQSISLNNSFFGTLYSLLNFKT